MSKPLKYILHLDDHITFLNGFQTGVTDLCEDYRIIQFRHPDEALAYIETSFLINNTVDIIITDYNHPGLDGYEFARAVKVLEIKYERSYKLPVLMVSMISSDFHPGEETIPEFVARNYRDEAENKHFTIEPVLRGIEEKVITATLGKNCTPEKVVEFLEYLTKDKIFI